ncbi:MAG: carotenoid biosynthesis protein [Candidatus Hodarchaeales archaeon]
MAFPLAIFIFEAFVVTVFSGALIILIIRRNWLDFLTLISATAFGVTLEFFNVLLYDTYHYNILFILQIGAPPLNIPISIGIGWGLIIYSAMVVSDSLNISQFAKPFIDTTLAMTIDLSMDAIAIRLDGGFWTWFVPLINTISEISFFGVPYGNFYGWWMVVLIFSTMVRMGRTIFQKSKNQGYLFFLVIPFISYIPLYMSMQAIIFCAQLTILFGLHSDLYAALYSTTLYLTIFVLSLGVIIPLLSLKFLKKGSISFHLHDYTVASFLPLITFLGFHLVFFLLGTIYELWFDLPLVLAIALVLFVFHLILHYFLWKKETKNINS